MLKTESVMFNGKEYIRTWSDERLMIERDGALYESAVDPIETERVYVETNQPIVDETQAEAEDYEAALARLGVE